jgi:hypothetical protein
MPAPVTTDSVWRAVEKQLFAVLGFVTPKGEARSAGIVYVVTDRTFYIASERHAWKARHIAKNPRVSLTITIPKRIPLFPWFQIPQATITCNGTATLMEVAELPGGTARRLLRANAEKPDTRFDLVIVAVRPTGDFVTYGVGIPLIKMADKVLAAGRAPVG